MKGGRKITIEAPTKLFNEMGKVTPKDKTGCDAFKDRRICGECAKKAFVLFPIVDIQEIGR